MSWKALMRALTLGAQAHLEQWPLQWALHKVIWEMGEVFEVCKEISLPSVSCEVLQFIGVWVIGFLESIF